MKLSPLFSQTRIVLMTLTLLLAGTIFLVGLRQASADSLSKFGINEQSRAGKLIKSIVPQAFLTKRTALAPNATIVVTSNGDGASACPGVNCTLRNAIFAANVTAGADTITFAIGTGPQTINLNSPLPTIGEQVTIDGTTQPGFTSTPLIQVNGAGAGAGANGLTFASTSSNSTVRGLVINRFAGHGINISGANGITIEGNYIGTDVARTAGLGNGGSGIRISSSSNDIIGGATASAGNVIINNGDIGVFISGNSSTQNRISHNEIHNNTGLGIDLADNSSTPGVTLNDAGDGDSGANNFQNFPVLASAVNSGGITTVTGTLNSAVSQSFTVEFYSQPSCNASGYGQGKTFLTSTTVNTDGSGNGLFNVNVGNVPAGMVITATATDSSNNTSEFSACAIVNPQADLSIIKTNGTSSVLAGGSTTYTITVSNAGPNDTNGATVADTFPVVLTGTWACVGAVGGTCTASGSGNISDTVNLPAGGSVTYTVTANISGAATGTLTNTATVSAPAGVTDPVPGNNSATDSDIINSCPSSFTVNNLGDGSDATPGDKVCATSGGVCTLRAAIQEANAITACSPLTINFSVTGTIPLGSALPALNHPNLTITGPGANSLTVSGSTLYRPFTINSGKVVAISGLTVANGFNSGQAGGVQNNGTLTMTECVVSGCTSGQGGGLQNDGALTMIGCTVSGNNTPTSDGGGMAAFGTNTTLTNCTFSGNHAIANGGGLSISSGVLVMTNCTVTNNTASDQGGEGGGLSIANSVLNVTLKNTIIAGNTLTVGTTHNVYTQSNFQAGSVNNLFGVGNAGGLTNGVNGNQIGVAAGNVLLSTLGNYGGPTQTVALLPGSPAINAGTNSGAPATDQRGIARPQQTTTDIGAFESQGFTIAINGGNNQSANIGNAFASPLSVTVSSSNSEPVNGGAITFTPPGSGASATIAGNPATISSGVATTGTVTANATGGSYTVSATAIGGNTVNFNLTNSAPSADLSVTKVDTPDPVLAGSNLTYTITVNNAGPDNAATASLSDTLPSGTTFVSLAPPGGWSCSTPAVGATGTVSCSNTTLGVGSAVFTLVVKVGSGVTGGVIASTAIISSSTTDPNVSNNTATATTTVNTSADLSVTKVDTPDPVLAGNNLTYTITVNNAGPSNAASVSLSDTLPSGTTFVSLAPPGGWSCSTPGVGSTGTVSCSVTSLGLSNAVFTLVIKVGSGVAGGTVLSNTATVSSSTNDPSSGNNSATATTTVVSCPSAFTVNDLGDAADAAPGDYQCATSGGVCTLRAAIQEANAITTCSPLTINFSVTGTIDLGGVLPDLNHPNLTINNGTDPTQLTVRRNTGGNYRIFTIATGRTVTINGLTIRDGDVSALSGVAAIGGGIFNNNGTLTLNDCVVANNVAASGGGMLLSLGMTTINRSAIRDNAIFTGTNGVEDAAGIYAGGTLTLTDSTISGNRRTDAFPTAIQGAGMAVRGGAVTATNCTFSGNIGRHVILVFPTGGGSSPSALTLTNCTVAGNTLNSTGVQFGAIDIGGLDATATATTMVKNTIVGGNTATTSAAYNVAYRTAVNAFTTLTSLGNNLTSDATLTPAASGDLSNTNPLVAALGNYGGLTQTHALLPGSSAINAGTASGAPTNDQRGIARVGNADIGAFESRGFTMAIAGGNSQSAPANSAFAMPLSVTVSSANSEPVDGGQVTFTPPGSGASASIAGNPATIASGSATSGTVAANSIIGGPYTVTASANGATAINFSLTNTNSAPTFTPAAAISRQQGSPAGAAVTVGTVSDLQTTAGSLTVTQIAGGTATDITVTGITNTGGTITAVVAAGCTATSGTVRFQVSDGNLTGTGDLTVNISPNTVPTLSYAAISVNAGSSTTNSPTTATDNGSITSYAVQSQGTYTGAISVNASGIVSISSATPVGSHIITIRATDNCGATTDATFSLSVGNNLPTITPAATLIRQRGTAGSVSTIATVSDGETPAGSLVVTATTVPAGITITSIVNNNGTITANIAAGCTATLNNNSIILTVTDGNSGTATGNLIVNVTDNSAPTLSYPASTVALGSALTVNATTASDNGSITGFSIVSVTPAMTIAPTVNSSGVVSITNAGPFGSHTIVVRATDNCGATTDASFTLGVGCGTITVNPFPLTNGLTFVSYTETLSATGGSGSYTFAIESGSLPAGLNLIGNVITGTPNTAGASTFTIRATDDNGCFGDRAYTLLIGSTGLMYYPLARPVRLLDTRPGQSPNACYQPNAPIAGNTSRLQPARGTCEGLTIPANATTLTGNVTTVDSGGGFVTLYPSDASRPLVANSNYLPNEIVNNAFTVGIGASDGAIKIYVTTDTDVVIDVTGYYAPPGAGGLYFHPLPKPIRLLETRAGFSGCQATSTPLAGGSTRTQSGIISCDGVTIPAGAQALVGNATTVDPQNGGYLTMFPADASQPFIASSNFVSGQIMNAPFTVGLSPSGEFKVFTTAATELVIDVVGYYSTQVNDSNGQGLLFTSLGAPLRLLDTRSGEQGCFTPGAPMIAGTAYTQATQVPCTNLTPTARALIGNATVVNGTNSGYLTFWPSNSAQPLIATSNYTTGQIFNRHFTVGLGPDGAFKRYSSATTDLVIDISGFFAP